MARIAILIHGGVGGGLFSQGQPAIQQLVERIAGRFQVDVFTVMPPDRNFIPQGYNLFHAGYRPIPRVFRWLYLLMLVFGRGIKNYYQVVYAFWGYPAGVVAVVLGKVLGIPSVIHLQGGDAVSVLRLKYGVFNNPLRGRLCRIAYRHCTSLIALTEFQSACLKQNKVVKEVSVIPFGPDTSLFTFSPGRRHNTVIRFLHIGNLTPVKGQEVMLRTFSHIVRQQPARLTIIGADYYNGHLEQLCSSLGIEPFVQFFGPQPHASMPAFYHNADILLHTPWYEGQGLVFAEASACGTIIAGTDVGMLSDMGDKCAFIVQPGEAELLAERIISGFGAASTIQKMQDNARRWVEEKDVNYTERRIVEVLNELLHADTQRAEATAVEAKR